MYVEFTGGTREPDGHIAPCEVVKQIPGHTLVRLSAKGHSWVQWVRKTQLLTEADVVEA